jgi:HlyD family secretion protein
MALNLLNLPIRRITKMTAVADPEIVSIPKQSPKTHTAGKWLFAGGLLIVAIGAAVFFEGRTSHKSPYLAVKVDRGTIISTVVTSGTLNAVITVQVGSQVSGNIIALYADFNTKVKKGQLVAEIDPAPFQAALDQAAATLDAAKAAAVTADATLAKSRSDLASAQANVSSQKANVVKAQSAVDLAKLQSDREQTLLADKVVAQQDADNAKAAYDQAVAALDASRAAQVAAEASTDSASKQVDVAQYELDQAKAVVAQDNAVQAQAALNLSHTRITAPVDGTVESRNMDVGQTVAASFQAPTIFLIAQDLTKMQVDTNVDEADVGRIHLDQEATFTVDAWPGRTFHGRVAQIREAPINVQNVITYDVVVLVSNEDLRLFPGMTANVTVTVGKSENALRIPKSALRFHPRGVTQKPGTQSASVLGANGQLRQVPIKTGLSDANFIEVSSGLMEGEEVVTGMAGPAAGSTTQPAPRGPSKTGF